MRLLVLTAMLLLGLPLAGIGTAQTVGDGEIDPRWLPWLGCWQLDIEPGSAIDLPAESTPSVLTCLRPAEGGSVDVATVAGSDVAFSRPIRADGLRHPVDEPACRGWQAHRWASSGLRLYSHSELECDDSTTRMVSGVSLIVPGAEWLDIQFVQAGESAITVRRYVRASDVAAAAAGVPSLSGSLAARSLGAARSIDPVRWTVEDVIEASAFVEGPVLEAALYETGSDFELDSGALVALDDAGVSDDVIDLMVALSYPGNFTIDGLYDAAGAQESGAIETGHRADRFDDVEVYSHYASPFGHYYAWSPYNTLYPWGPYPYGYSTFYMSYGYGLPWRRGGSIGFRGGRPGRGSVRGSRGGGGSSPAVVSPRGYTRRPAVRRSGGGGPETGAPTRSSGSASAPPAGRGGAGRSGGVRRAKPRTPPSSGPGVSRSAPRSGGRSGASSGSGASSRGVQKRGYRRRPPSSR